MKNLSKYQIQEMTRNGQINDRDNYHHCIQLTKDQIEEFRKWQHLLDEGKVRFKDIIKRLYSIRKDISDTRILLSEHPKQIVPVLKHDQLAAYYEVIAKLKSEGKFTLENIYGFKRVRSAALDESESKNWTCIFDQFEFYNKEEIKEED